MSLATSSTGISWDLRDLFSGFDDPRLTAAIDQVYAEAEHFAAEYRGSIDVAGGPAAEHLLRGLERIEALWDALARPVVYANLLFSADTSKPEHRDLQQQMEQHNTSIANLLLFFELDGCISAMMMPSDYCTTHCLHRITIFAEYASL
ncbi:MAG: hypothetical protein HC837_15510 [Chloroflexaceae bacterium]|nr:hypothetical protein [Chloroflexaceae bacterium]